MIEVIGQNFFHCLEPGSMGVVKDTRFIRCYWPSLDQPTALFAAGSSGIEVQGPPTPRNVVFPDGVVFLPVVVNDGDWRNPQWRTTDILTKRDCFFLRTKEEQDVEEEFEVEETLTRKGQQVPLKYMDTRTVRKEVDKITELSLKEALERVKNGLSLV